MASYKELKEQFVTGYNGSDQFDILQAVLFMPLSILLRNRFLGNYWIYDFLGIILPSVLAVCWTDYQYEKLLILLFIGLIGNKNITNPFDNPRPNCEQKNGILQYKFITLYRSLIILATTVSILAVDFPIFPRRFVKTEDYGISLMDSGTGSVLFSSALVARFARDNKISYFQRVSQSILGCLPLLIIGLARFFIHKSIDYQEHVSEYGVHWNFFMSLCGVTILSAIVNSSPQASGIIGIFTMAFYQIALNSGLENFIMNAERTDFLTMNREGIFGCIGLFTIYQMGLALKPWLTDQKYQIRNTIALLTISTILMQFSFSIYPPSRRINNISYSLFIIWLNIASITAIVLIERSIRIVQPSQVIDAINFNQFPYFMISNLLTGAVNLSIQTLFTQDATAFLILIGYITTSTSISIFLNKLKLRLKFW